MARLLISLGANLGNSYETMLAASRMLVDVFGGNKIQFSRFYITPPVGGPSGQSDFLNAVARIETELNCWEAWDIFKQIEKDLGRQRQYRWEARRLDMDILLYEDARVWTPHLKIPHPRMCMRSFVLVPAMEVAPNMIEPVSGWSIERLHENLLTVQESTGIVVYSNDAESSRELSRWISGATQTEHRPKLCFATCESPNQIGILCSKEPSRVALRIFCVRTPEPETIQWEDFASPWASALGLVGGNTQACFSGPRYLLPDNDLSWTVHEIEACRQAMTCPIHPLEA